MLIKVNKLIIVFFITSFILTGCWDSRDVHDKDIVTAVITDYAKGKYSFIVEIANIRGNRSTNSEQGLSGKFSVVRSYGDDFPAARYNLDRKTDSPVFLGATRAIVLTDRLARSGIEEYMNRIRGTPDYRKTTDVVTTSTPPRQILNDKPENDISAGFAIEDTLRSMSNIGIGLHIDIGDILQSIAVKHSCFVLSQIDFMEDENTFTGYSVFKDAKMVGFIPADHSKGLVYLLSSNPKFLYEVEYNENKLVVEVSLKKKKVSPQYHKKNVKFEIELQFDGRIQYMNKLIPINQELKEKYNEILKSLIYKDISDAIKTSQEVYKCDYLNFYKEFRISFPQDSKTINWNEAYCQADMEINIDTDLKAAGLYEINPKRD